MDHGAPARAGQRERRPLCGTHDGSVSHRVVDETPVEEPVGDSAPAGEARSAVAAGSVSGDAGRATVDRVLLRSTNIVRPPASRPQKADHTLRTDRPDAVTTNVTTAASRPSGSVTAPASDEPSAGISASPATAITRTGGDSNTNAVATPAPSPRISCPKPNATVAIQRRAGFGCASGPAVSAAVIAARLTAWPPNGAPAALMSPVVTSTPRSGGSYPYVERPAARGTF